MLTITSPSLAGQRILIRADLNVPLQDGHITSDTRIRAALSTIEHALQAGAQVLVMSHLGRPREGEYDQRYSLQPVADHLAKCLDRPVSLVTDWQQGVALTAGEIALLENVRFNIGEKDNDPKLAQAYADLCDIFVMDAFGSAHRAQASTHGVARFAPIACAGILLQAELSALDKALANPARPLLAVVGGAKVSTKLPLLKQLAQQVDQFIVGGGIANTFLAASGQPVGQSLYEPNLIPQAQALLEHVDIVLPQQVVTAKQLPGQAEIAVVEKAVADVSTDDKILDGVFSAAMADAVQNAGTIIWNGPIGAFEWPPFARGTEALAQAIAESAAFSLAGGGDTLAAIDQYGIKEAISYISTGGGAFLDYIEGNTLPAVAVLEERE